MSTTTPPDQIQLDPNEVINILRSEREAVSFELTKAQALIGQLSKALNAVTEERDEYGARILELEGQDVSEPEE